MLVKASTQTFVGLVTQSSLKERLPGRLLLVLSALYRTANPTYNIPRFFFYIQEAIKTLTDQEGKRLQTLLEEAIKQEKENNKVSVVTDVKGLGVVGFASSLERLRPAFTANGKRQILVYAVKVLSRVFEG